MKKLTWPPDISAPSPPPFQEINESFDPCLHPPCCSVLVNDQGQDWNIKIFLDLHQDCLRYKLWHAGKWENMDYPIDPILRKKDGFSYGLHALPTRMDP